MHKDNDNLIDQMNNQLDYEESPCNYCPYMLRQMPYPPPFQGGQQYNPHTQGNPQGQGFPHGNPQGRPPGPPPTMTPHKNEQQPGLKAVSPGSIRPCTYRYVYIWLDNGRSFWAWLTNVDRRTASGFRWQYGRWVYFGIDLRRIESFECF